MSSDINRGYRCSWMLATVLLLGGLSLNGPADAAEQLAPRLISYISSNDGNTDWANPDSPYTHYILSFVVQRVPNPDPTADLISAGGWTDQPQSLQFNASTGIVDTIHAAGKKAMLAYGGATMDWNYYKNYVGKEVQLAQKLAQIVKDNDLDGIDVDWEDTAAFTDPLSTYNGRKFVIDLTTALRDELPRSEGYELSHAPQSPYLDASQGVFSGYTAVMQAVGDKIDFLNMQYYNNTPSDPAGIVAHYKAAINAGWLKPEQLVVGKPVTTSNAGSGYVPVADIRDGIVKPLMATYGNRFGGMFNWEFKSDTNFDWGNTLAAEMHSQLPGDFNNDHKVDAADYTIWRDHLGEKAGTLPNDTTTGEIGQAQHDLWKANFGATSMADVTEATSLTAVPEPSTGLLALGGIALLVVGRRVVG